MGSGNWPPTEPVQPPPLPWTPQTDPYQQSAQPTQPSQTWMPQTEQQAPWIPPEQPGSWTPPTPPSPSGSLPGRRGRGFLAVFLAAILGVGAGSGVTYVALHDRTTAVGGLVSSPVVNVGGAPLDAVAGVAKAVQPSIVNIDVSEQGGLGSGTGSGVIYRSDGYILTNNHVIEGASDIQVTLATGEQLSGRVVGTAAPAADIAVVKVDKTGLPAARLGSTKELQVGDLAVAMGSPFGLQGTVTAGVISALHRNITLGPGERFSDAIQTDAPINPGNSGGALADAKGDVVGINTAIVGTTGGNVGVGFAIPIDIARRVADQIIAGGHASLPFIGISGQNLPNGQGALVQEVVSGGPAASGGIKPGDIIVALGGEKIGSMDELIAALIQRRVGERIAVVYTRNGQQHTTHVTLAARPEGS